MDDLVGHFLIMVGEACTKARTGNLPVHMTLADGRSFTGVPLAREVAEGNPTEADHTGFAEHVVIGGAVVYLMDIVELRLLAPGHGRPPQDAPA